MTETYLTNEENIIARSQHYYAIEKVWKIYVEEHIIPLNLLVKIFILFHNALKRKIHNVPYSEILKDESLIMLLRDDNKIYGNFFGVCGNIDLDIMTGKIDHSAFMNFVESIHLQTNKIIDKSRCHIVEKFEKEDLVLEEFTKDPDRLMSLIGEFYNRIINITANSNEQTMFIISLHKITRKYLENAYPEFKNKDKFDILTDILGLDILIPPLKIYIKDDLLYLPQESFGGLIYNLNEKIWNGFNFSYQRALPSMQLPDIRKDYLDKAKNVLLGKNIPVGISHSTEYGYIKYYIHITGKKCLIIEYDRNKSSYSRVTVDCNISMEKFFSNIGPFLYLGVLDVIPNNNLSGSLLFDLKFDQFYQELYNVNIGQSAKLIK